MRGIADDMSLKDKVNARKICDACSVIEDEKLGWLRSDAMAELYSIVRFDCADCRREAQNIYGFRAAPTVGIQSFGLWKLCVRAAKSALWSVGSNSSTGQDVSMCVIWIWKQGPSNSTEA